MQCYRLSICVLPQVHILKPNVHCDAIRRGALWKRLRPLIKESTRTSLVAQCLRLHLPMQRVWV